MERLQGRLMYKLIICLLFIVLVYLINFNIVTSEIYENQIAHYQNEIEYDQHYREKAINTIYRLIDKKTLNEEVDYNVQNRSK